MKDLDLEHQYQLYLERVGLKEHRMNPIQKVETKRAFMGACGQMLVLFRDVIGSIEDEKQAVEEMEKLFKQVLNFWNNESAKLN